MEFGTPEERTAVRDAALALAAFNQKLDVCNELGISCDLKPGGRGFIADFTKTIRIIPAQGPER